MKFILQALETESDKMGYYSKDNPNGSNWTFERSEATTFEEPIEAAQVLKSEIARWPELWEDMQPSIVSV